MPPFWQQFHTGMTRAVAQENRRVSSSLSKPRKRDRGCLLMILLMPLALVLGLVYVLNMLHEMIQYEEQTNQLLLQQVKKEKQPPPPKQLVLVTKHGNITIHLRPDWSEGSVDYIHRLLDDSNGGGCSRCQFYRAERPGILQGVMAPRNKQAVPLNRKRGDCPEGFENVKNDCPPWDKQCGCHGPVMTQGMVAWAAGQAGGPDFFIDNYKRPAEFWGTQHTNFGLVQDETSLAVLARIVSLPVKEAGGMHRLVEPISFQLELV